MTALAEAAARSIVLGCIVGAATAVFGGEKCAHEAFHLEVFAARRSGNAGARADRSSDSRRRALANFRRITAPLSQRRRRQKPTWT